MYSRYDPTLHDTFLPVSDEHTEAARKIEFPPQDLSANPEPIHEPVPASATVSASTATATADTGSGGLLSGLKGLFGGLQGGQGFKLDFDLGDMILLLIIALLFLEGGETSDIIILIGVVLLLGF